MPSMCEGLATRFHPDKIVKSSTTVKPMSKFEPTGSNTIEGTMTPKRDGELHTSLKTKPKKCLQNLHKFYVDMVFSKCCYILHKKSFVP
jgi:hypothetical protein